MRHHGVIANMELVKTGFEQSGSISKERYVVKFLSCVTAFPSRREDSQRKLRSFHMDLRVH